MKKLIILILITLPIFSYSQNASVSKKSWVNNPPTSKDKLYAVGIGTSASADIAERKAHLNASAKLAELVEPAVESVTSRIDSIVRGNKVLIEKNQVIRKTVIANLNNVQTIDVDKIESNGTYTAYVLVSMPKREITQNVVEQINKDKELYRAVSKSKEYKKMLKETK
ncbi:MAG: hypothetical protein CVT98_03675 [Bacteroidetes bacterium HGW-Bacteroidetes-15]|nr:MAG: hypothetical protein CVT98_03675 [Bacteroidetes bacterium HGW-Bacteroidetes-15]